MKNLKITIEFWREGKLYIANCPELDILAQGYSLDEARKNLYEVIEIHFEEMKRLGTLDQFLENMGYKIQDDIIISNREIIGFDKSFIRLEAGNL
jgi:predicted RNase H-like HicB family nuclease